MYWLGENVEGGAELPYRARIIEIHAKYLSYQIGTQ